MYLKSTGRRFNDLRLTRFALSVIRKVSFLFLILTNIHYMFLISYGTENGGCNCASGSMITKD